MPNPLGKIIDLVNTTGDRVVVVDQRGEPAYVIVPFADYQRFVAGQTELVGLTEEQLMEKINRDIATWKASQDEDKLTDWPELADSVDDFVKSSNEPELVDVAPDNLDNPVNSLNQAEKEQSDDQYYFEPID